MKKILFFILLSMSVTCFGQGSQNIDSIQTTEVDSIHAGSHAFPDTKLEDATKAEGDSAYIKDDYTTAIQIYESLIQKGDVLAIAGGDKILPNSEASMNRTIGGIIKA